MRVSIPKMVVAIVLTAGAGAALLFAYGHLGPKTEPPDRAYLDIDEAQSLLVWTESAVLTLSRCPPQPTQDNEARELLRAAYGDSAQTVWEVFYDDLLDHPTAEPHYNQEGVIFPLIFHRGVEIEAAYLEIVENPSGFSGPQLTIREHYTGDDPLLEGFWRENIYRMDEGRQWQFHEFRGTVCLRSESLFSTYLPLKQEYALV